MKQDKEMPFNGDFEDSDADEDDISQESESEEEQISVKKKKKKVVNSSKKLIMNVSDTQYPVVKFVGKIIYKFKLSYVPYLENNNWDFCWTDNAVLPETLSKMQPHQRINHFPGMYSRFETNFDLPYEYKLKKTIGFFTSFMLVFVFFVFLFDNPLNTYQFLIVITIVIEKVHINYGFDLLFSFFWNSNSIYNTFFQSLGLYLYK